MKYTFISEPSADWQRVSKVTFEFEELQLGSVVQHFEDFLRGCGFHFDGRLDFVEEPKMELQDAMPHINKAFDDQWGEVEVTPEEEAYWGEKK